MLAPVMLTRERMSSPNYDQMLLWVTLILLGLGLVMVYSASIAIAEADIDTGHKTTYYLVRQSMFILIGLCAGAVAFQVPVALWQKNGTLFIFGWLGLAGAGTSARHWSQCER